MSRVYVVITNTDLTEGCGMEVPLAVCEMRSTAERIGKNNYIQGSNCPIIEYDAKWDPFYKQWIGPIFIMRPSVEDIEKEKAREKVAAYENTKLETIRKMHDMNFPTEMIDFVRGV
jgi:hypothetical protein